VKSVKISNSILFLFLCLLIENACSQELRSYASFQSIGKEGWHELFEPSCQEVINDSLALFRIDIAGRLKYTYLPDSLSLIVTVTDPLERSFCDTLSFAVAAVRNRPWEDFRFPWCGHVRFLEKGTWRFSFRQNMDVETLRGVIAIGVYIRKE
jgi:gliding motility-associated lipoprotein GldH